MRRTWFGLLGMPRRVGYTPTELEWCSFVEAKRALFTATTTRCL
jgi:hypothetical protein